MSTYRTIDSTMGKANPAAGTEGVSYYYQGDPTRTPDSRHFKGPTPETPRKVNGENRQRSKARDERIARFAALLDDGMTEQEAAAEMFITLQTAQRYARELRKQQEASP